MDKKEEKIKEPKLKEKIDLVIEAIGKLTETVNLLIESKKEQKFEEKLEQIRTLNVTASVVETPMMTPIPLEYRLLVDNVLNRSFGIEIIPRSDAPLFEFAIIVPEKYSTMTPAYKQMYKVDRRPKVMNYAEGTNGIREWCEKVFNNFNQDYRSMIVADRVNAK